GLPLRELIVSYTSIGDAGMEVIGEMKVLRRLEVDGGSVTLPASMAGPEHLARFAGSMGLGTPSITDRGLRHLKDLTGLQVLRLGGNPITDDGLEHLAGLRDLRRLNLWGTDIGDAGLAHLRGLTAIQRLELGNTRVAGPGLAELKGMTRL